MPDTLAFHTDATALALLTYADNGGAVHVYRRGATLANARAYAAQCAAQAATADAALARIMRHAPALAPVYADRARAAHARAARAASRVPPPPAATYPAARVYSMPD